MKIQNIVDLIHQNKNSSISVKNGKYIIQIYFDGNQGNIKEADGTVICRFVISNNAMRFAPAKKACQYEFGYEFYSILLLDEVSKIFEMPLPNAKYIYDILLEFAKI